MIHPNRATLLAAMACVTACAAAGAAQAIRAFIIFRATELKKEPPQADPAF